MDVDVPHAPPKSRPTKKSRAARRRQKRRRIARRAAALVALALAGWLLGSWLTALVIPAVAVAGWYALTTLPLRRIQFTFEIADPKSVGHLEVLKPAALSGCRLNGQRVPEPFSKTQYERLPGLRAEWLNARVNVLALRCPLWLKIVPPAAPLPTGQRIALQPIGRPLRGGKGDGAALVQLVAVPAGKKPALILGPVLGWAATDAITLACHINRYAALRLTIDGRSFDSPAGLLHRFRVDGLKAASEYAYSLEARNANDAGAQILYEGRTSTFADPSQPFRFAVCGDNRDNAPVWRMVSQQILERRPMFVVHSGDGVKRGMLCDAWNEDMFAPARELLARIPFYAVAGNHENISSVFDDMFVTPAHCNWHQRIGPLLLIGIDAQMNWSPGGALWRWLDGVLAAGDAPFVIVVNHFPAYSSTTHGARRFGIMRDPNVARSQKQILPLLARHRVTAMISAHDHFYQRSEPGCGVTLLISAGAGGPFYAPSKDAEKQNPFSKVLVLKTYNYLLFSVAADRCEMRAVDLDGAVLDTCAWSPRM